MNDFVLRELEKLKENNAGYNDDEFLEQIKQYQLEIEVLRGVLGK